MVVFPPIKFAEPVLSYAIEPKSRGDEDKISTSLQRLQEEDPTIRYDRDPQTKQLLLSGQGQLHIEVTVAKLKRRFGVGVNLKLPRIPYRETITASTEAHGRHKKQTGGHGSSATVRSGSSPSLGGQTSISRTRSSGGPFLASSYQPSKRGSSRRAREASSLDTRWSTFASPYSMASSTPSTRTRCRSRWLGGWPSRTQCLEPKPTILEPVMNVEVYAPSDFAGDLMGDLNGRRGRISGMETRGASTVIKAQVPMAEMLTYEQQLTSTTGGRGSYHMEFSHYEEVPAHLHAKVIADAKAERGEAVADEE